ncbi:hypothetical protein NKH48_03340 [Mesorhizobium sp. M1233]
MWLYIPNTSTSSQSAPEEAASISASSWQFQALAVSCSWRGKPSPSRNWFQRWNKVSFIRLLCGAMPEPSTASAGVDAWMASLAASRARVIPLPGRRGEASTSATSGHQPAASSSKLAHGSSSSKTSAACSRRGMTTSLEPKEFGETFASWVSRLRADCSRRQKSVRATSASASLSSAWPTPDATNRVRDEETLAKCAAFRKRNAGQNTVPLYLAEVAQNWPTPTANDWKGSGPTLERKDGQMRGDRLDYATEQLWSTPRATDGEKGGPNQSFRNGTGLPLPSQAHQWSTPSVADTTGGRMSRSGDRSSELLLKGQAAVLSDQWATPRAKEDGQWQNANRQQTKQTLTLTGQAQAIYSPLAQVTVKTGKLHSKERRSLNPLFVEWLMGWPPGWTLLVWTDLGCSETALCLFKQRMRFALSQLALPAEAPPAQLALFG